MKKFTNLEICKINMANCIGLGKKSFAERLSITAKQVADAIEQMTDIGERLMALQSVKAYRDCQKGYFSVPIEMDSNSSMFIIDSCFMKDAESLEYVGVGCDTPQATYKKLEAAWKSDCEAVGVKTDEVEDFKHEAAIPYGYCGESCVRAALGKKGYEVFKNTFKKALPKCAEFREACLDAWDGSTLHYDWELPDAYEVSVPVLGDPKKHDIHIGNMTIGYRLQQNEPRPKWIEVEGRNGFPEYRRNNDTRSLGANITHSYDAYVLREIVRRCGITYAKALEILKQCDESCHCIEEDALLERLERCSYETGIISARWFYLLENNPVKLPKGIRNALERMANTLSSKSFELIVIHDAFGCTANHVNALRKTANQVFADLYAGDVAKYFGKKLGIKLSPNKFDKAVYEAILDSDYLVH